MACLWSVRIQKLATNAQVVLPFLPTASRASSSTAAQAWSPPPVTCTVLNLSGEESTLLAVSNAPLFHCSWRSLAQRVPRRPWYVLPRLVKWPDAPVEPRNHGKLQAKTKLRWSELRLVDDREPYSVTAQLQIRTDPIHPKWHPVLHGHKMVGNCLLTDAKPSEQSRLWSDREPCHRTTETSIQVLFSLPKISIFWVGFIRLLYVLHVRFYADRDVAVTT